jgi:hypothetical protein
LSVVKDLEHVLIEKVDRESVRSLCCANVTVPIITGAVNDFGLTPCRNRSHFTKCNRLSGVPKAYPVRVPGLRPSKRFSRSPARGWMRAARCCLVVLACLAQLLGAAQQHQHMPGFAAHAMVHEAAAGSDLTPASFDAGQSGVPCAVQGTRASPNSGDGPAPCHHGDCPFCPCPCCCSHVHTAMGILPQETARAAYAPLLSITVVAPPALLGSRTRFAAFAGQPRAPPILI